MLEIVCISTFSVEGILIGSFQFWSSIEIEFEIYYHVQIIYSQGYIAFHRETGNKVALSRW
jgi:hypothetical protein